MSELKDYSILDIEAIDDERLEKCKSGKIQETRVYIKSEADKVIRHQKYKRCKAMEEWCDALAMHLTNLYDTTKSNLCRESLYLKYEYFRKWQTRWLELAEKFKEGK